MDDRLQQLIREIGDAPAFPGPLSGLPHERGMTYRQWLIGNHSIGPLSLTVRECAARAIGTADVIIEDLARERLEAEK